MNSLPVSISLGTQAGTRWRSSSGVRIPSSMPNMEERPRQKSMMKKRAAQSWEPGISITASVNTMKASPVPEALCEKNNCYCGHRTSCDEQRQDRLLLMQAASEFQFLISVSLNLNGHGFDSDHSRVSPFVRSQPLPPH